MVICFVSFEFWISTIHMIRKENDKPAAGGRRPLLLTFVGNNRQMLNEIRDSLSHLRKHDGDGRNEPSNLHLRPELSQSTPNLLEKCAGSKMTRRDNQHHKALAEIRDSLRPYQNLTSGPGCGSTGSSSETSSTASSSSSRATREAESHASKIQKLMQYGFDEDIAGRALMLSGNQGVEEALQLLVYIMDRLSGGIMKGGLAYNHRPSCGPSSPATSETNSVRSDSPTLNTFPQQQSSVNGLQTPPPLPPRAPIVSLANQNLYTQAPATSINGKVGTRTQNGYVQQSFPSQNPVLLQPLNQVTGQTVGMSQAGLLMPGQNGVIPHGHVQHMIHRISPGQVLYHTQKSQPQAVQASSAGTVLPQRGVSPTTVKSLPQQFVMSNGSTSSPSSHLAEQLQNMNLGAQITSVPIGPSPGLITSEHSQAPPPPHYQAPPPPYSQAWLQIAAVSGLANGTVGGISPAPHWEHLQNLHHVPPTLDFTSENTQVKTQKIVTSAGVPATRLPMGMHTPVIMPSVHSKEVTKPMPQTATAPSGPTSQNLLSNCNLLPNHITQLKAQMNMSSLPNQQLLKNPHQAVTVRHLSRVVPRGGEYHVPITHLSHYEPELAHHNGKNYSLESSYMPATVGQPQLQQQSRPSQNLVHNTAAYQKISSNASAPRSNSPASQITSQSPNSLLLSTPTPSTNPDIPDKPPPPYPFRNVVGGGLEHTPHPPLLPPRVPLKDTSWAVPGNQEHLPHPGISTQILNCPPAYSSSLHQTTTCSSLSFPPVGPAMAFCSALPSMTLQNEPTSGYSLRTEPQTDNAESSSHLVAPQAVNGRDPSEADEPDMDTSSVQSQNSSSNKCTSCSTQEKHRCLSPLPERRSEARERDRLRCDTKVKIYSQQAFKFYMEQHVENVLKSHSERMDRRLQLEKEMAKVKLSEEAAQQMRKMLYQKESNYIRLKRAKMDSSMFDKIQTLGVGAFGEVALVRKKDVKMLYAMKTLKKSNVIKRNQVAHVKAERDILAEADNEWVVKLYYSFQDEDNLYFVMDYVPGGDLMGLLIRKEILDEHLAQFYIAELVLAVESVHRMGFIHRDIKPDNILIDKDGHIKLTDFGLCTGFRWTHNSKYYQKDGHARQDSMEVGYHLNDLYHGEILKPLEQRRQREQKRSVAHSLVGTPNYIAPEVLQGSGYTESCDWWSIGVILYEMVIGQPPFYATNPAETQHKVIHWKETLMIHPHSNISLATADLILKLLQGPESRLGRNGAAEVKAHPFFAGIHMEGLRKQPAPYKPIIRNLMDTSNFDPVDTEKLKTADSEGARKVDSKLENGKHPEHAFFEFTFRRFFDDGGHPCIPSQAEVESNSPVYV